jgi:hypothetical protein
MNGHPAGPPPADVASEGNALATGLGIITFTFFPFALPALVFVVAPLALLGVVGLLLAAPVVLPVWVVRRLRRRRAARAQGVGYVAAGPSSA